MSLRPISTHIAAGAALLALSLVGTAMAATDTPTKSLTGSRVKSAIAKAASVPGAVAAVLPANYTLSDGSWEAAAAGWTWRLRVSTPGATTIALHADRVALPSGTVVEISGAGTQHLYRGSALSRGKLWTSPVLGDTAIIEIRIVGQKPSDDAFHIDGLDAGVPASGGASATKASNVSAKSFVVAGTADADGDVNYECVRSPGNSRAANATVNVNLRKPDLVTVSTGTLVNNTANNRRPFVVGARHAEEGPSYGTVDTTTERKFHWNATVPCGDSLDIAAAVHQTAESDGATVRAMFGDTILWELDEPVPAGAEAYFAGVDATTPTQTVQGRPARDGGTYFGIHHAGNGPKQFLEDQDSLVCAVDYTFGEGSYCREGDSAGCVAWITATPTPSDYGRALPGSSGSGLFSIDNSVIGTLVAVSNGGNCATTGDIYSGPTQAGLYQALYTAWDGGGTPATALRFWLDAANTGNRVISGLDAIPPPVPTATLTVAPAAIVAGSTASITWSSSDATACTASGSWSGSKSLTGSESTGALGEGTYTYSLSCNGAGGNVSKTASVRVTAPPPPAGDGGGGGGGGGGSLDLTLISGLISLGLIRRTRRARS